MQDLQEYLNTSEVKNQKVSLNKNEVVISTIPQNGNLTVDYIFILIALILSLKINEVGVYLTLVVQFLAVVNLWQDFNPVNHTIISLAEKKITIKSKNILKNTIQKKKEFNFSAIESFYYLSEKSFHSLRRYTLYIKLKDSKEKILTDFLKENDAAIFVKYLDDIVGHNT